MLTKVCSYAVLGLEAYPVTIEVDVSPGLPATIIVGLPDNTVKESKERVRLAIKNSGYRFVPQRITVNLAPADIKKEGPCFDLAIALGLLAATDQIDPSLLKHYVILGELSLDGNIQPIQGILPMTMAVPHEKFSGIIVPFANAREAAMADHINVYPVKTLAEVVNFLTQTESIKPFKMDIPSLFKEARHYDIDFSDVKGQWHVKRGLEVAAAGGHNALLVGTQYNRWNLR